jgi:transcriptional regulator with XRE-family HTH domain
MEMKHPLETAYESCMSAYEQSRTIRSLGRKTFASQLRETRRLLKLTVRELGDKIGVTGSLVNQIEVNSKSILKKEQVEKVIALCYKEKRPYRKQDSKNEEESSEQSPAPEE